MKITAKEVRAATGNRYAARVAALQLENAEIYARARRADDVVASIPQEFRAVFRAAVEAKGEAFTAKVNRWQQAVDLDPEFWAQPCDPTFYGAPAVDIVDEAPPAAPVLRLVKG